MHHCMQRSSITWKPRNTRGKRQAIKLNGLDDASLHAKKQHNLELPEQPEHRSNIVECCRVWLPEDHILTRAYEQCVLRIKP
jgi:hypothetical protein